MGGATPPPDAWCDELAAELLGKLVIAGFTFVKRDGSLDEQKQFFGRVEVADRLVGIVLALEGRESGRKFTLPADTRGFKVAPPGHYRLSSTGEVVVDPDYTISYTGSKGRDVGSSEPPTTGA